jgi:3-hydroxyacyl-CoA dehydrogenase
MTTPHKIAIIGAGTIGLSFVALHLTTDPTCEVSIYDTRPDLESHVRASLPHYLPDRDGSNDDDDDPEKKKKKMNREQEARSALLSRLTFHATLRSAVEGATIVQEQGPESAAFKTALWPQVEQHAPAAALLWSSTSGIPASAQGRAMREPARLLVVHPYNPPHLMPLLEIVPGPATAGEVVERTVRFWRARGRTPVVLEKECVGFVANRLAFALLREACSLVAAGVVSPRDLDAVVTGSMGPRWAVAGPFESYKAGGGEAGFAGFMEKIGATVGECWRESEGDYARLGVHVGGPWQRGVCEAVDGTFGPVDVRGRDRKTRGVLEAVKDAI